MARDRHRPGHDQNLALLFGNDKYTSKLPADWLARDVADAALVICVGESEFGAPVETYPYGSKLAIINRQDVTFHKIAIPMCMPPSFR